MKRNFVLPNLKLRQMNIAGICMAAIFQDGCLRIIKEQDHSLQTLEGALHSNALAGSPSPAPQPEQDLKGRQFPKSSAFYAGGGHGRTRSRGEVSEVRCSSADEVSQTHLLCDRSHAFYESLAVPQRRAKITWKNPP